MFGWFTSGNPTDASESIETLRKLDGPLCMKPFTFIIFSFSAPIAEEKEMIYENESDIPVGTEVVSVQVNVEEKTMWGFLKFLASTESPDSPVEAASPVTDILVDTQDHTEISKSLILVQEGVESLVLSEELFIDTNESVPLESNPDALAVISAQPQLSVEDRTEQSLSNWVPDDEVLTIPIRNDPNLHVYDSDDSMITIGVEQEMLHDEGLNSEELRISYTNPLEPLELQSGETGVQEGDQTCSGETSSHAYSRSKSDFTSCDLGVKSCIVCGRRGISVHMSKARCVSV